MSKIKFTLTVTIEGESLEQVDDGLVEAVGQRLMARMENPPTLNGQPVVGKSKSKPKVKIEEKTVEVKSPAMENPHPSPIQESPPVRALRAVFAKYRDPGVEECLAKFNVSRVGELTADQIEPFIQYCNAKLEVIPQPKEINETDQ